MHLIGSSVRVISNCRWQLINKNLCAPELTSLTPTWSPVFEPFAVQLLALAYQLTVLPASSPPWVHWKTSLWEEELPQLFKRPSVEVPPRLGILFRQTDHCTHQLVIHCTAHQRQSTTRLLQRLRWTLCLRVDPPCLIRPRFWRSDGNWLKFEGICCNL